MILAPFGDVDDLVQRQDLEPRITVAGTIRIGGIEPAAGVEPFELVQGEARYRRVGSVREYLGDVGVAPQRVVVNRHQHAILGSLQVQLQIVDAQIPRQQVGRSGRLRRLVGGAAVGDHRVTGYRDFGT